MADLEEAVTLGRQGLGLQPYPHKRRSKSLWNLILTLGDMYEATGVLSDLQEAIMFCEELLDAHYRVGHENRAETLLEMVFLLDNRFKAMGQEGDLARIEALEDEWSYGLLASTS